MFPHIGRSNTRWRSTKTGFPQVLENLENYFFPGHFPASPGKRGNIPEFSQNGVQDIWPFFSLIFHTWKSLSIFLQDVWEDCFRKNGQKFWKSWNYPGQLGKTETDFLYVLKIISAIGKDFSQTFWKIRDDWDWKCVVAQKTSAIHAFPG